MSNAKYRIVSDNLRKIVANEEILKVLTAIENEYPLSIIEKSRLKNSLSGKQISLWITNSSGKITFVNENLKEFLAMSSPEGFSEQEAFLSSVSEIVLPLTEQVIRYSGILVRDEIDLRASEILSGYDVIKIPILDSKENVVATVGIIQPSKVLSLSDREEDLIYSTIEKLNLPFLIFDFSGRIKKISSGFAETFGIIQSDIPGKTLSDFFGKKLGEEIDAFLYSEDNNDEVELNIKDFYSDSNYKNLNLYIKKIFNRKKVLSGGFITLVKMNEENIGKVMEEKIYDIILRTSPQPIFIYDSENLIFLAVNDAALALYGYDRKSFLTLDLTDLYSPENIQTLLEANEEDNHSGWGNPVKNKRKDGTVLIVRMSKVKINYNGKDAVLTYLDDSSKTLELEKEIKEFRAFSKLASDAFVETDAEGFILRVNPAFTQLFSFSDKEISGDSFVSLITDQDRGKINKSIFINKQKEEVTFPVSFKSKNGKTINANAHFLPILDFFNEVISYSIFIKPDVSKAVPSELIGTVIPESSSSTNVSGIDASFLGHLFHELLTPINVIIGFSQELAESIEKPTPEQLESAEIIKENQKALKNLMDAASEYVALEEDNVEISPVTFSIVDILDEVEERVKKVAQSYGVTLKYGKISSSITLINDKERVISLVAMFWEFAVRGSKEGQVYLSAMQDEGKVLIIIRDDRKTISQGLIVAMNEFLTEDENIIRRNYGISRFAVRLFRKLSHLLQVSFTEVKKGNEIVGFAAQLPVAIDLGKSPVIENKKKEREEPPVVEKAIEIERPKPKPEPDVKEKPKAVAEPITNKVPEVKKETAANKTIVLSELSCLLLEDQIDSQILFKQQMKELKNIEVVPKFEDALPLLKSKKFDFIVMDINLQGEYNGLDALHEIRNIPSYSNVPIIAATAYVMPGDHDNYIRAGFDDFISKPIMREKMLESLKRIL